MNYLAYFLSISTSFHIFLGLGFLIVLRNRIKYYVRTPPPISQIQYFKNLGFKDTDSILHR